MREIKFRIWDRRIEEMYQDPGHFYVTADGEVFDVNTDLELEDQEYELMQYTGLKDKNQIPIYEGDIVKDKFGEKHRVDYLDDYAAFGLVELADGRCIDFVGQIFTEDTDYYKWEVIGNIYQSTKEG